MIVLETLYRLIDLLYTMVLLLIFCETLTIRKNKILQILALCLLWFIGTVPIYSHDAVSYTHLFAWRRDGDVGPAS